LRRIALFALLVIATTASGQSAPPAFEVASVKPSDPNGIVRAGRSERIFPIDMRTLPGGRFLGTYCTLKLLIEKAWSVELWQIAGGPGWIDSDRFDIDAKAEHDFTQDNDASQKTMAMLQTLLTERFNLKVHRETREDTVYSLVVSKNGPKLQPSTGTDPPFIGMRRNSSPEHPAMTIAFASENATMALLAERLSYWTLHRPVLDKTGLSGNYSVKLEFAEDDSQVDAGPSLFTAIQDQLGLKLEPGKGPVELLVVDRAQRASPN